MKLFFLARNTFEKKGFESTIKICSNIVETIVMLGKLYAILCGVSENEIDVRQVYIYEASQVTEQHSQYMLMHFSSLLMNM